PIRIAGRVPHPTCAFHQPKIGAVPAKSWNRTALARISGVTIPRCRWGTTNAATTRTTAMATATVSLRPICSVRTTASLGAAACNAPDHSDHYDEAGVCPANRSKGTTNVGWPDYHSKPLRPLNVADQRRRDRQPLRTGDRAGADRVWQVRQDGSPRTHRAQPADVMDLSLSQRWRGSSRVGHRRNHRRSSHRAPAAVAHGLRRRQCDGGCAVPRHGEFLVQHVWPHGGPAGWNPDPGRPAWPVSTQGRRAVRCCTVDSGRIIGRTQKSRRDNGSDWCLIGTWRNLPSVEPSSPSGSNVPKHS